MTRGIEFTTEQLQSFKDHFINRILGENSATASSAEKEEATQKFYSDSEKMAELFSEDFLNTASLIKSGDSYTIGTVDILLKKAEISDEVTFAEVTHGSDPNCSEIMKFQIEELGKNTSKKKLIYPIDLGNGRFSMLALTKDGKNKIQTTYCDPIGLNVPQNELIPITQEGALKFTTIPSHCVAVITETLGIEPNDIAITRNEIQPTFFNSEDNNQRYTYGTESGPLGVDLMIKFAKGEIDVKTENYEGKKLVSDLIEKTKDGWSEIKNQNPKEAASKAKELRSADYSTVISAYREYFSEVFPDKVQALEELLKEETKADLENDLSKIVSDNDLESDTSDTKLPSFLSIIKSIVTFGGILTAGKLATDSLRENNNTNQRQLNINNSSNFAEYNTINPLNIDKPIRPTSQPSSQPSRQPTSQPTIPTSQPTSQPTNPTSQPSRQPTGQPTGQHIRSSSFRPSAQPISQPSVPSSQPTSQPNSQQGKTTDNCHDMNLLYLTLGGLATGVVLEALVQGFTNKGSLVNAYRYAWKEGNLGAKLCSLTPGMFVTGLGTAIGVGIDQYAKCPAIESGVFSAAAYASITGMWQLAECLKNDRNGNNIAPTSATRVAREYQMTDTRAI